MRHIPGKRNPVADFLSRSYGPSEVAEVGAVNTESDQLRDWQSKDPVLRPIGEALAKGQHLPLPAYMERHRAQFLLTGNIIGIRLPPPPRAGRPFDNRIRAVVPMALRDLLLQEAHNSSLAGHQGMFKTMERIKEAFWWPNMDVDVANHLCRCTICQATSNKDKPPTPPP